MHHTPFAHRSRETLYIGPRRRCCANGFGIAGFTVSLLALIFTLGILSPLGLMLSFLGMLKRPRGLATAGVAMGLVGTLFWGAIGFGVLAGMRNHHHSRQETQQTAHTHQQMEQAWQDIEEARVQQGVLPDGVEGNKRVIAYEDAWEQPLRYEIHAQSIVVRSSGPDKEFESSDDLTRQWQVGKESIEAIDAVP